MSPTSAQLGIDEASKVEVPFVEQLKTMGWDTMVGDIEVPEFTERENFRQVLLIERLKNAIRSINLDENGNEWLDDTRLEQAVDAIRRVETTDLLKINQNITELLVNGMQVDGDPKIHGSTHAISIKYIDFERPENNDFLAIQQFRVDPPWCTGDRGFIIPDIVLFVNGIPVVVVECKSPAATNPMEEAITQLLRYANRRDAEEPEGAERLFFYNQFTVATKFDEARVGTITASYEHYNEWKDTSPTPASEVAASLDVNKLRSQHMLVAGMLNPAHLLDIIQHFVLFQEMGGRTIKIVCRYQQFRAVHAAIHRLLNGKTRLEDGEFDRRGGIIWHTQGSGKSITMVFLIRKMRSIPILRRFKVVVVTDRTDLEDQLSGTATLTNENVRRATTARSLRDLIAQQGADLVFAMIQKYRITDEPAKTTGGDIDEPFPLLNDSEEILVLVDEAHRSQSSELHANLLQAMPNCARIGFTGTPIIMGQQKRTHEIFGEFIDRYTIQQSEADGFTVPILYEGRQVHGAVNEADSLEQIFEAYFDAKTPEELDAISAKFATKSHVLEAEALIQAKARDILRHYVDIIMPNGFKAQLVSVSRLAAIRYQKYLDTARDELVQEIETVDSDLLDLTDEEVAELDEPTQVLVRGHHHIHMIRTLEFAAVISSDHNDPPEYKEWSDSSKTKTRITRFKKPLDKDPLAFLCVKSMLLTGFDAPMEQVMYLDRFMQGHELLQAIARVNRTADHKKVGIVVDYFGVGDKLQHALCVYSDEDVQGALVSIKDELPKLKDRHARVVDVFASRGIDDLTRDDDCVDLLRDVSVRAEFIVRLKQFLESLDNVMPRPEGVPYLRDAKLLGYINKVASNRYRDSQLNVVGAGPKVRELIDRHIVSQGIDPKVPPIAITDANFEKAVQGKTSPRAKASEMEHAARHHISTRYQEDPAYFKTLSERLEEILQNFEDNWDELVKALSDLTSDIRKGRPADESGLDPRTQAPFLGILLEEASLAGKPKEDWLHLRTPTIGIVDHISQELKLADFWRRKEAQAALRQWLINELDDLDIFPFEEIERIVDRLMQLARSRHVSLTSV